MNNRWKGYIYIYDSDGTYKVFAQKGSWRIEIARKFKDAAIAKSSLKRLAKRLGIELEWWNGIRFIL